jgi:hypothetical protein
MRKIFLLGVLALSAGCADDIDSIPPCKYGCLYVVEMTYDDSMNSMIKVDGACDGVFYYGDQGVGCLYFDDQNLSCGVVSYEIKSKSCLQK